MLANNFIAPKGNFNFILIILDFQRVITVHLKKIYVNYEQ